PAAQAGGKALEQQSDAVNTDPRESDLLRIPVSEFPLRLCSIAPRNAAGGRDRAAEPGLLEAPMVKRAYGHPVSGRLWAMLPPGSACAATLALGNGRKAEPTSTRNALSPRRWNDVSAKSRGAGGGGNGCAPGSGSAARCWRWPRC